MNTYRELLETAAKAANFTVTWAGDNPPYPRATLDGHWNPTWNPLENDGDALRLAVKLRIEIEPWIHGNSACARAAVGEILIDEPHCGDDPGCATRRAIVRAAAAMVAG